MEKVILDCHKCGGRLSITQDMELFKCEYCDTPYMVKREGGITRIIKLEEKVEKIGKAIGAIDELRDIKGIEKEEGHPVMMLLGGFVSLIILGGIGWVLSEAGVEEIGQTVFCMSVLLIVAFPFIARKTMREARERDERKASLEQTIREAEDDK